jgi:hypothetical protein
MHAALDALLTLAGQNTFHHDALVELLIAKGVITGEEWDAALERQYRDSPQGKAGPAGWARRCIDQEDNEALDAFFAE